MRRAVFSVLVHNEYGVVTRISGLFTRRGFNIKSFTGEETEDPKISRITIVAEGDERELAQIKSQVEKLVDVIKVVELDVKASVQRELALMKKTAILINTARGGIVDEKALIQALEKKAIAGAGLDVYEQEPPTDSPLRTLDNVVLTSHIGAHTFEAISRMGRMAAENVVAGLSGQRPPYLLNAIQ